jgi:soluble lytic murein transglycosylase-like protein
MQASIRRQVAAAASAERPIADQRASVRRQAGSVIHGALAGITPAARPLVPPTASCDPMPAHALEPLIHQAAREQELAPELLRAVIAEESGFRPCVVSSKGAVGLMQLMPETAGWLGVANPFDPQENVASGARFLKYLLLRYGGKLDQALAAYNAGPGRVDRAGGIPPIRETRQYLPRILHRLKP